MVTESGLKTSTAARSCISMRWFYQGAGTYLGDIWEVKAGMWYVCLPDHLRYSFESDNDFSRTDAFLPDWIYSGLRLCASTMGQALSSAVELRRKSNFTIDMGKQAHLNQVREMLYCGVYGDIKKKLLMISQYWEGQGQGKCPKTLIFPWRKENSL